MQNDVWQARIDSYFSLPTDLAAEMRTWPQFVQGEGYYVDLQSDGERVTVRLVDGLDDEHAYVLVRGEPGGHLFLAALGCVTYALSAHSDEVMVMRWNEQR